jgi:nucleolar MIF4G domain-containing protein 1
MIETLSNLKNNRMKKQASNQGQEAVDRLKKFISSLGKKRHGKRFRSRPITVLPTSIVLPHEPLRVKIEDLRSADTKGKWWLVGAAWRGDPLVEKQGEIEALKVASASDPSGNLNKLARKQGMNTDIRRSIFIVLMTSEVSRLDNCH